MRRMGRLCLRGFVVLALFLIVSVLGIVSVCAFNRFRYAVRTSTDSGSRAPAQFYVRPSGSDGNSGTSPDLAWKTIDRINRQSFVPGDSILFEGSQQFTGSMILDADDRGTANRPIRIASFGNGTATIAADSGNAILIYNTGGVSIQNLKLLGSGDAKNGIMLYNDLIGGVKIPYVRINSVDVSGFARFGIGIEGNVWGSGFRDVRIEHAVAHDNVLAGIYAFAAYSSFLPFRFGHPHRDIYVGDSEAYNNSGVSGPEKENSGSGIVLSALDHGIIERSIAHHNGFKSNSNAGGPVGIWAWDADSVTIQFNRSYDNRTSGPFDGGGFDLDGGTTHSIMQYNYSSGNDGAGYLVCRFPKGDPTANNIVRYNVSVNDGRKNSYGALFLFGGIDKLDVYNNTILIDRSGIGSPVDVKIQGPTQVVHFRNNLFYSGDGLSSLRIDPQQDGLLFQGNAYISPDPEPVIEWAGTSYHGLSTWRTAAHQEAMGARLVGVQAQESLDKPPRTYGPGHLLPIFVPILKGAGLDLKTLFGLDPGSRDYCGAPLSSTTNYDIGAQNLTTGIVENCPGA
jgi:hypothetical protein